MLVCLFVAAACLNAFECLLHFIAPVETLHYSKFGKTSSISQLALRVSGYWCLHKELLNPMWPRRMVLFVLIRMIHQEEHVLLFRNNCFYNEWMTHTLLISAVRVSKCKQIYTEKNFQTKFYPKKSV